MDVVPVFKDEGRGLDFGAIAKWVASPAALLGRASSMPVSVGLGLELGLELGSNSSRHLVWDRPRRQMDGHVMSQQVVSLVRFVCYIMPSLQNSRLQIPRRGLPP